LFFVALELIWVPHGSLLRLSEAVLSGPGPYKVYTFQLKTHF